MRNFLILLLTVVLIHSSLSVKCPVCIDDCSKPKAKECVVNNNEPNYPTAPTPTPTPTTTTASTATVTTVTSDTTTTVNTITTDTTTTDTTTTDTTTTVADANTFTCLSVKYNSTMTNGTKVPHEQQYCVLAKNEKDECQKYNDAYGDTDVSCTTSDPTTDSAANVIQVSMVSLLAVLILALFNLSILT